jgi:hypothetical protein
MKKVDLDPFSNGTEHMMFEAENCDLCIKSSKLKADGTYTNCDKNNIPNRCSIERDIVLRMFCNEPISELTIMVCNNFIERGIKCPYMKTGWPKKPKSQPKEQMKLEL